MARSTSARMAGAQTTGARAVALALAVLIAVVALASPALAQEEGPEERNPVEAIAGIPIGEVCTVQGTLVLLETVARASLPPELLRTLIEILGVPFQGVCTLVPPRDRLTRCSGDAELNDATQGLVGIAPVGDVVQLVEEVEGILGIGGTVSAPVFDALACERFRFGQSDGDPDGEIFEPPTRPTGTTPSDPLAPTTPSRSLTGTPATPHPTGVLAGTGTGASDGADEEVAAPSAVPAATDRLADQLDLFAVVVCLALLAGTAWALLPEGLLAGLGRGRRHD